jgi:uncharacterized membrane protein
MLLFIGLAGLASLRFVETPQDADWITEREFIEEESEKVISFIFLIISLILWIREPSNYASWGIVIGVIMVLHSYVSIFLKRSRGNLHIDWQTSRYFRAQSGSMLAFIILLISALSWLMKPNDFAKWGMIVGSILLLTSYTAMHVVKKKLGQSPRV